MPDEKSVKALDAHLDKLTPIERSMCLALCQVAGATGSMLMVGIADSRPVLFPQEKPTAVVFIHAQTKSGPYIADFTVRVLWNSKSATQESAVVVECDGHDFHEKTKEQAQRDKKRDRWFVSSGVSVMRFTGSEIYRDAHAAAKEVFEALFSDFCRQTEKEPPFEFHHPTQEKRT